MIRLNVLLILVLLCTPFGSIWAQTATPAVPKVTAPTLPYAYPFDDLDMARLLKTKPFVIELFTSLDCLFCPRAEKLVSDMASKTSAIILACHTDPEGDEYPVARDFCVTRQTRYAENLSDGLLYTPQMVINGHVDAVGHEFDDVALGLKTALNDTLLDLKIRASSEPGIYAIDLPRTNLGQGQSAEINLFTYRKPYAVPKSMRQSMTHPDPLIRIVKRMVPLGAWDGRARTVTVPFSADDEEIGFTVLVQREGDEVIGAIDWVTVGVPNR